MRQENQTVSKRDVFKFGKVERDNAYCFKRYKVL